MTQQIILRPIGLVTQPNKLGVYDPGALSIALRCRMRDPGTLENGPTWTNIKSGSSTWTGAGQVTYLGFANGPKVLVVYRASGPPPADSFVWQWIDQTSNAVSFSGNYVNQLTGLSQKLSDFGQMDRFVYGNRVFVVGSSCTMVFPSQNPTTSAEATPRIGGLMPASIVGNVSVASGSATGGALDNNKACHYTAIIRRKLPNGDEMVSAPCAAIHHSNTSGAFANVNVTVREPSPWLETGDVIEIYRTRAQTFSGATSTNTGADYFLSATYTATAGFTTAVVLDSAPDANLGQALYTNQAIGGAAAASLPPPVCISAVQYKGHAFYFGYTDPPQFKFRIPVAWGAFDASNPYAIANGIGRRTVTGTSAIGNPTWTGISAANMVGVQVGQIIIGGSLFGSQPRVISFTATSITFNQNATLAGSNSADLVDQLEINGNGQSMEGPDGLFFNISGASVGAVSPTVAQCLSRVYSTIAYTATASNITTAPAEDFTTISRWFMMQGTTPFSIRATNGQNYVPAFPNMNVGTAPQVFTAKVNKNGVAWSEYGQPENVPGLNSLLIGKGEIYRAYSLRDSILIFASDGLWRLSGTGGTVGNGYDWRRDPIDATLILSGPRAGCVLRDMVYAYTNRGFISVDGSGQTREYSIGRLNDQLPGPQWPPAGLPTYQPSNAIVVECDETNDEIMIREPLGAGFRVWIYNTLTDSFVQDIVDASFGVTDALYSRFREQLLVATAGNNASNVLRPDTTFATMDFKFQPFSGGGSFLMRRWQQLEVVYQCSDTFTIAASVNSNVAMGSRALSATFGNEESEYARTSFGVPVAAPAFANSIAVRVLMSGNTASRVRLQGIALKYLEFTEQRKTT
jgi:hypothetical protein